MLQALRAAPDGYTLFYDNNTTSSMMFATRTDLPLKLEDRTFIARTMTDYWYFFCNVKTGWKTIEDAFQVIRSRPEEFTWAAGAYGSAPKGRLVWEHFGMGQLAARETLRGRPDLLSALGMTPRRPRRKRIEGEPLKRAYVSQSFSTRVSQARTFYDNALASPEIIALLSARGYDAVRLAEGQALLADWTAANDAQEAAKGMLTKAYADLDAARGTARRWYLDARMIARRALRGRKDLQHALGMD